MSFVVSIAQLSISGASPGITVSMPNTNVAAATANVNVNIATPDNPNRYFSFGMLRVKSGPGATGTLRVMNIWASDGNTSNITNLYAGDAAAPNVPTDHTYFPLVTDIKANQVIVSLTASAAGTCDIEFVAV